MAYPQKNIHHQVQRKTLLKDTARCGLLTKAIWWGEFPQHSVLSHPSTQPKKSEKQGQNKTWKLVCLEKRIVQLLAKLSPLHLLELPPPTLLPGAVHLSAATPIVELQKKNGRREKNRWAAEEPSSPWFKSIFHFCDQGKSGKFPLSGPGFFLPKLCPPNML